MKTLMSSIQWMAFMIAGAIAAPIAIADLFHMNPAETASFVQRTIFVLGLAGLLQGIFGHRLPVIEGPAGLWWGVFAIYSGFVGTLYSSSLEALQILTGALLVSGLFFFVLTFFGLIDKLGKLFTPSITFIYLFLLILQLSGSFVKGMLGLTSDVPYVQPSIALLSIVIVMLTFYLGQASIQWVRQFSILLGLIAGWILFAIFGLSPSIPDSDSWFALPELFAFGIPAFDIGAMVSAIFITVLLTTNMITSVRLMETVVEERKGGLKRGGFISGINQLLGGMFAAIGSVPISGTAGFVTQTGMKAMKPFLLGALLVVGVALMPPLINAMSAIPAPVGYAVTFVIFTKMIGLALSEFEKSDNKQIAYTSSGIALLIGVGTMFLPAQATVNLPAVVASLLNNGLVLGTVAGILTEQYLRWKTRLKLPLNG